MEGRRRLVRRFRLVCVYQPQVEICGKDSTMKRLFILGVVLALAIMSATMPNVARANSANARAGANITTSNQPDFGPNVYVFDPSMTTSQIQATVDGIAAQQINNEMGTQRYTLLFKPGTYGTPQQPLAFQVGYYTEVAGLGASPTDVTINGTIDVYNQCPSSNFCIALDNFWRSLSNLTINVTGQSGCRSGTNFWAVSQ